MSKKSFLPGLFLVSLLGISLYSPFLNSAQSVPLSAEKILVLYDASSGSIPDESLMDFTDFPPGTASLTYVEDATVMDTGASGSEPYAGWVSSQATTTGFPVLDRTAGVQLNFSLQVESENHSRNNRAGFSVILLDQNAKGIELSFWENEIWAQNDDGTGGLFTRGERAPFETTTLTDYQVILTGDTYTLLANSAPILQGPVRDYSKFDGFPDPYETPNFLFMGDDTTSAQARVHLRYVSVMGTEPVVPTIAVTSTSTNTPAPTASLAPPPSATPLPISTATPAGRSFQLCPSGWLLFVVLLSGVILGRMNRR